MKKLQRQVYLALAYEIDWGLCGFCRYLSGACDNGECKHPIDTVSEMDVSPGDDCWAFRPELSISDVADIVGIILANQFDPQRTIYTVTSNKSRIEIIGTPIGGKG